MSMVLSVLQMRSHPMLFVSYVGMFSIQKYANNSRLQGQMVLRNVL